jgi:hypothetical protein
MSGERLFSEDEILSALRGLDRPIAPRPEFAAELYAVLRRESHRRGKAVPTLLAAALLATGLIGAAVIASQLNNHIDEDRPAVVVVATPTTSPIASEASTFASPEPPTSAPPTPTLRPTPAAAAMQPVWRDDDSACRMNDVVIVDDGLIAAGWCFSPELDYRTGVAWHSDTGFEWRRVFEVEDQRLIAVSPDGDGEGAVLLVAPSRPMPGLPRVFRGDQSAGFEAEQLPDPQRGGSPQLVDIARVDRTLFVAGTQFFDGEERPAAWISSSSQDDWRLIDVPADLATVVTRARSINGYANLMVAHENGFVVAGDTTLGRPALWRYDSATGWAAPDQVPSLSEIGEIAVVLDAETVILDVDQPSSPLLNRGSELWTKVDGEWRGHAIGSYEVFAAHRVEDGFIVTGVEHDGPQRVVLTSGDGMDWDETRLGIGPGRAGTSDPAIYAMVEFGGRVIGVGGNGVYVGPASVSDYSP